MRNSTKVNEIRSLLKPMLLADLPEPAYPLLAKYVDLLDRWGARINLTAVRDRETLIGLHLGECLRCAQLLPSGASTVLDLGSGAGLPGIPIQIARPELSVMLVESRVKKAAFLRETIRTLELERASVFYGRAEDIPINQRFDVVTLRATERISQAIEMAGTRLTSTGQCVVLTTESAAGSIYAANRNLEWKAEPIPGTRERILLSGRLAIPDRSRVPEAGFVPRGTNRRDHDLLPFSSYSCANSSPKLLSRGTPIRLQPCTNAPRGK